MGALRAGDAVDHGRGDVEALQVGEEEVEELGALLHAPLRGRGHAPEGAHRLGELDVRVQLGDQVPGDVDAGGEERAERGAREGAEEHRRGGEDPHFEPDHQRGLQEVPARLRIDEPEDEVHRGEHQQEMRAEDHHQPDPLAQHELPAVDGLGEQREERAALDFALQELDPDEDREDERRNRGDADAEGLHHAVAVEDRPVPEDDGEEEQRDGERDHVVEDLFAHRFAEGVQGDKGYSTHGRSPPSGLLRANPPRPSPRRSGLRGASCRR